MAYDVGPTAWARSCNDRDAAGDRFIIDDVMGWMKWLRLLVATLAVLVVCLTACGSWRWNAGTTALLARLEAARAPHAVVRYDAREIDGLPAPVQRYFRAALTNTIQRAVSR